MNLFSISLEYRALFDLIENDLEVDEETGEITDNSKQFQELFNDLQTTLEDKLDNCQRYCLTLDGEADVLANEIKRLQARKKAIENKKDRLRKEMLSALEVSGINKLKTPLYSFSIKETESVNILDDDLLSRNYLRIKYEADKNKIKEAIKNGEVVEGAIIAKNRSIGVR